MDNKDQTYLQVTGSINKRKMSVADQQQASENKSLQPLSDDQISKVMSPISNLQVSRECANCFGFAP